MNRDDRLCWYHKSLAREEAEDLLKDEGRGDGVFLVRDSNTSPGDYVLSVLYSDEVFHYQIRRHGDDAFFSIDDQAPIHGLDSLIEHYQKSSDGLVTQLTSIIPNEPPPAESRCHGRTNLLHRATKIGNLLVVEETLDTMSKTKKNTFTLDAKDQDGRSVVHLACLFDNNAESILAKLISSGANVNCRDEEGNTPLHYACRNKSVSLIKMLVDANAYIDARNNSTGCVPLHEAANNGNLEVVKFLLDLGVPHLPRCTYGQVPAQLARDAGHIATAEYLEKYVPTQPTTNANQWYHGTLNRAESERIFKHAKSALENEDASGTFLIRHSVRENSYVLGLLDDKNELKNYVIKRSIHHYFYIDEGPYMLTLEHLVQHYMRFSDGLPTKLRYPVQPIPKPPLPPPPTPGSGSQGGQGTTPPKGSKFFKKMLSDDSAKERMPPKDMDTTSITAKPEIKERNLSLPSDDLNNIGLSGLNANQLSLSPSSCPANSTVTTKPKKSPRKSSGDIPIFNSLKFPKGRNIIIDGMKSLKISRKDGKSKSKETNNDTTTMENSISSNLMTTTNDNISMSLKNLTFSSDINDDSTIYKVPNNIPVAQSLNDIQNQNVLIPSSPSTQPPTNLPPKKANNGIIADDLDLFTQSDKDINLAGVTETQEEEDNAIEEIYFVEAPTKALPISSASFNYVAFKHVPFFPPANAVTPTNVDTSSNSLNITSNNNNNNNNNAENTHSPPSNATQTRAESSLSVESTFSNELELMLSIHNQTNANGNLSDDTKTSPNYYIPATSIQLNDVLGIGEFGSVYKGHMKCEYQNGESKDIPIAVKTLHDEHCRENRLEFLREASVMIKLSHHCIIKMIGISKGPPLMIVQELVSFGSLLDYLQQNADKIKPNFELKIWASQIACGMHYLETQHFVHRDLAARNILLSSLHQAKISDFGLSRALCAGDNYYQTSRGGKWPIKWYAPESCNFGIFSHASDVWSFGVTLFEMYSFGEPPYGNMKGADVIKMVEEGNRLSKPDACPDSVFNVMNNCWNYKAKDRPTFRFLTDFFSNDPEYQNLIGLIKTQNIN